MVDFDESCECGDCVDIIVMDHEPIGFVQTGDPESPQKCAFPSSPPRVSFPSPIMFTLLSSITPACRHLSYRFGNSDVEIGRGHIQVQTLIDALGPESDPVAVDIDCRASGREDGDKCKVFLRVLPHKPFAIKTFFLIRHGQSVWNAAQEGAMVHEMVGDTDHPLSHLGIQQCNELAKAWKATAKEMEAAKGTAEYKASEWGMVEAFLEADVVCSSPLVRAVQTAWIGLEGHPSFRTDALVLTTSIREHKKTIGGLDTMSHCNGKEVAERALRCLEKEVGELAVKYKPSAGIDPGDAATGRWWTPGHRAETELEYTSRFHETWCDLKYRDFASAVLVGHSYFFRDLFVRYLGQHVTLSDPDRAQELKKKKLQNAGCVAIQVDFSRDGVDPVIVHAEPMFGCEFV